MAYSTMRVVQQSDRLKELIRDGFTLAPNPTSSGHRVLHKGAERRFLDPQGEEVPLEQVRAAILTPTTPS